MGRLCGLATKLMLSYPVYLDSRFSFSLCSAKRCVLEFLKKLTMAAIFSSNTASNIDKMKEETSKKPKEESKLTSGGDLLKDTSKSSISPGSKKSPSNLKTTMKKDAFEPRNEDTGVQGRSFLLLDEKESLQVKSSEELINKLGIKENSGTKVLSIFGNTGDGKSHTLNHTFFDGEEVFKTSASQLSCTVGVWASYDRNTHCIILDTEGLLGMSGNQNQRTRLLLKVLAISDIIIYRTRAERLHTDMFTFLGDASEAYLKHFSTELYAATERLNINVPLCTLGPAVVIFHETQHTDLLGVVDEQTALTGAPSRNPDDILKQRFADVGRVPQAFSSMKYLGTRTYAPPTDFNGLKKTVRNHLEDNSVRSARSPQIIFNVLMFLNEKFCGDIERTIVNTFPDAYFTCQASCLSCNCRCQQSMNHEGDSIPHQCATQCQYQAQYDNRYYLCKLCHEKGKVNVVIPKMCSANDSSWLGIVKYAWSGYVLECPECGIIFRSREYWYGNRDPVESVARPEIKHVWPGEIITPHEASNAARRVLDGVKYVTETVTAYSAPSSRAVTNWLADQVAPDYWVPNSQLTGCQSCQRPFADDEKKHHCRSCGGGFCDECSSNKRPVPERGWGTEPVRVCDGCYYEELGQQPQPAINLSELSDALEEEQEQTIVDKTLGPRAARKMIEGMATAVETIGTALEYPREILTDAARPSYWIPDSEITECYICKTEFKAKDAKHHCRGCGQGVCDNCSKHRYPVPSKGWDQPVRVCDHCVDRKCVMKTS